jgi:hypothetical protein
MSGGTFDYNQRRIREIANRVEYEIAISGQPKEDKLALTANFMKYQLMELIISGQIKNSSNEYDSRDFTSLNEGSRY